jgi:hypothetical protein
MTVNKYTYKEATELIEHLLWLSQKMRSNAREAVRMAGGKSVHTLPEDDPIGERVLYGWDPLLYGGEGDINLTEALSVMADKAQRGMLQPIDLYNALFLCNRSDAMLICYSMTSRGKGDLPKPQLDLMLGDWQPEPDNFEAQS